MSFFSVEFLFLIAITVFAFYSFPVRLQWWLVLGAGLVFYAAFNIEYAGLMTISILIDFFLAQAIELPKTHAIRKRLLVLSLALNLGLLFFFKYFNFFSDSLSSLLSPFGVTFDIGHLRLALPLGISFITFAKIGYMLDVYNHTTEAEQNLGFYFLFVGFFPNLTSGPIERAGHLLPQFKQSIRFDEKQIVWGMRRILWGAFKKVVIAERLAAYVDGVYGHPKSMSSITLILAIVFFAFQIYADFSGYTDIALGIAELFGIKLFENFRQPYFAFSILDFWRRWHMSLTNWIREFMFMPLSRYFLRKKWHSPHIVQLISHLTVMSLIGLWHGANWTFLIWGFVHGLLMGIETLLPLRFRTPPQKRLPAIARTTIIFMIISLTWVLFRANTLSDAGYVFTHLFSMLTTPLSQVLDPLTVDPITSSTLDSLGFVNLTNNEIKTIQLVFLFGLITLLLVADWLAEHNIVERTLNRAPTIVRWSFYYAAIVMIFVSINSISSITDFVYVQF